jgi:SAM-dependent methyltransferase
MPTIQWLKKEFDYGYDSGNVLGLVPNRVRRNEEKKIGGSYRKVFQQAIAPFLNPDSTVLELGPGRGAWSRAILKHIPYGQLITVDYQDVTRWLHPEQYCGRLICHQVFNNRFDEIEDQSVDFFWSMGVLCHNNQAEIAELLQNALPKMKPGGVACHQYSDWDKLDRFGWTRGGVPEDFQEQPDDEIWWPRNNQFGMQRIAESAGWQVITPDMELVERDSLIQLRR